MMRFPRTESYKCPILGGRPPVARTGKIKEIDKAKFNWTSKN